MNQALSKSTPMISTPSMSPFKIDQPSEASLTVKPCFHRRCGDADGAGNLSIEEQGSVWCKDKREHVGGAVSQRRRCLQDLTSTDIT